MGRKPPTLERRLEVKTRTGPGDRGQGELVVGKWRSGLLSEFKLDFPVLVLVCLLWGVIWVCCCFLCFTLNGGSDRARQPQTPCAEEWRCSPYPPASISHVLEF